MATAAPAAHGQADTSSPWRWRGAGLALIVVSVAAGLGLRAFAPSPLWLDEALSVRIAGLGFGDMTDALRHDGHPSLYYLLLGWWMDIFGDSNGAARSLSAVASTATVPVLWALGRRRSPTVGIVAGLVALSSPFLLRYGTEARMYALVTLLVAVAWLAVERALDAPTRGRLAVVALATAALIHTHYWSFWLIGAALIMCIATARFGEPQHRRTVLRVAGAIAAGAASFILWIGVFLDQLASTGTPWADRARPAEIAIETMQAFGGNNRVEGQLLGVLLVLLAVAGTFGIARTDAVEIRFARSPLTIAAVALVATLAMGGAVALVTAGAFESRYAAIVAPFALLLVARGLAVLPPRVGFAATAIVVLFGLAIGIDEARRDRTQAGEVASVIATRAQAGDVIAFCPDQVGPATHRALELSVAGADLTFLAFPRGDGRLVDWSDYADVIEATSPEAFLTRLEEAADGHDIWLVAGLGYNSLGNRCEAIIDGLTRSRAADQVISPSTVFEPMLLTRYESTG